MKTIKTIIATFILSAFVFSVPGMAEEMKMDMSKDGMMKQCQEMMEQKQKMKEEMKVQDAQLTEQLAQMNRAPDDKKLALMAAVLTQMVEQRISMDEKKAKMEEGMMKHMMEHMPMGKESMSQCPMMRGMDEKSGDDHKEHQ